MSCKLNNFTQMSFPNILFGSVLFFIRRYASKTIKYKPKQKKSYFSFQIASLFLALDISYHVIF